MSESKKVKDLVEQFFQEKEWTTFNTILRQTGLPAPQVYEAVVELIKEGKVERKGRYLHYVKRREL